MRMFSSVALGPGREFDVVRELVARWGGRASGIGDDAAVLDVPAGTRLVASTDGSIENVHFRRGWLTSHEIGYRATVAAMSDLAAMASTPFAMLVAMAIPESWRGEVSAMGDGIAEAASAAGARIVGGNTTGGAVLSLTLTVLGHAERPLGRGGARAGDAIYVTGRLGGPLAALRAWEAGGAPSASARDRFAHPTPRLAEARWLAEHGAVAAIDISDGLLADLRHLTAASSVRMAIDLERVPLSGDLAARDAIASGEEYELAVTASPDLDADAFVDRFGVPLSRVGDVSAGDAGVDVREGGTCVDLPAGHDHFSR